MNSDTGYPASSKGRQNREETNMDSGHDVRGSQAKPMRVAAMRPSDSGFRVAEREDGGTGIAILLAPNEHSNQDFAEKERLDNKRHDNSHGHHAIAVPANSFKVGNEEQQQQLDAPTDHHSHHRHQCDDDDCSDHGDSHHHLPKSGPTADRIKSFFASLGPPTTHAHHDPFNAPAHMIHAPGTSKPTCSKHQSATLKQKPVVKQPSVASFRAAPTAAFSKEPTALLLHHHSVDPLNAPAHQIHALAHSQPLSQSHTDDLSRYSGPTPEEEIAHLQHVKNRQRGDSYGHHAIAFPAHRPNKIKEDEDLDDPTDYHNHHRHQCDDDDCSDHDYSHHHLIKSEDSMASSSLTAPTQVHVAPQYRHITQQPAARPSMSFAKATMSSALKSQSTVSRHTVDPLDSPVHLIHAAKKAQTAAPKAKAVAPQTKPIVRQSVVPPKTITKVTPKVTPKAAPKVAPKVDPKAILKVDPKVAPKVIPKIASSVRTPKARPAALNRHSVGPFNTPAHLIHAVAPKQIIPVLESASAPTQKFSANRPASIIQYSEHSGRSVGHRGHHALQDLNPVTAPEYYIEGPQHHAPSQRHSASAGPTRATLARKQDYHQTQSTDHSDADQIPEDELAHLQHIENRQCDNSHGHHAIAVPDHREHRSHHQHEYDDATDKHDHFRHQPHDEDCGEYHDEFGYLPLVDPISSALGPVKGPQYDIEGPSRHQSHKHKHRRYAGSEETMLPLSWFTEPLITHIATTIPANTITPEESAARRHLENKKCDNSDDHHAIAVPTHRNHKPHHNHENDDATDKHNHFRYQPRDENCGGYHDSEGYLRASRADDSPLLTLRKMFSAANSSGVDNYTYAEAVTHKRHAHLSSLSVKASKASRCKPRRVVKSQSDLNRQLQHLGRSYGHRGHHAQRDLKPAHKHNHHRSKEPILPLSWFEESTQYQSVTHVATVQAAPDTDTVTHRRLENKRRYNSGGHHAIAVPAHRPRKHKHNHDNNDPVDKHHFRHQSHDESNGELHDNERFLRASAAFDSPLLALRRLFSAANSSGLGEYTYAEAVSRRCHLHYGRIHIAAIKPKVYHDDVSTLEMNLGSLFAERSDVSAPEMNLGTLFAEHSDASTPKMNLGALFAEHKSTSHLELSYLSEHLGRSYGHHGYHPQQDLNHVERPDYDIIGPQHQPQQAPTHSHNPQLFVVLSSHRHSSKVSSSNAAPLNPSSSSSFPTDTIEPQKGAKGNKRVTDAELEAARRRQHLENKRRGNSRGHHVRAIPARHGPKYRHNHDHDDPTGHHDHF
ncbi:hypothetical protein BGX23_012312 [Mortierella sp. AD031]|nr:hypothetical protein BGX23_012312 [Mortierella sp. AD031]